MKPSKEPEKGTGLMGYQVITLKEGESLGHIQDVFMTPQTGKLSALTFKENLFGKTYSAPFDEVDRVGKDIVFVKSHAAVVEVGAAGKPGGENLKSLRGRWITTQKGEHIGTLSDVDFDRQSWEITLLLMTGGMELPIGKDEVSYGKDEIIVSSELKQAVRKSSTQGRGFLSSLFSPATSQSISAVFQRSKKHGSRRPENKLAAPTKKEGATPEKQSPEFRKEA